MIIIVIESVIHQIVVPTARTHPVVSAAHISLRNVMRAKFTIKRRSEYPLITRRNEGLSIFSIFCNSRLTQSPMKNATVAKNPLMKCQLVKIPPSTQKCSLFATPGARFATKNKNDGITPIQTRIDQIRRRVPREGLLF